jgi:hypothetical protein
MFWKKKVNNSLRKTIINHLYSRHWEPSTQDYISLVLSWPSAFTDVYKQRPNEPNESLEKIEYSKSHLSIFIRVFYLLQSWHHRLSLSSYSLQAHCLEYVHHWFILPFHSFFKSWLNCINLAWCCKRNVQIQIQKKKSYDDPFFFIQSQSPTTRVAKQN